MIKESATPVARLPLAPLDDAALEGFLLPDGTRMTLFEILGHSAVALADLKSASARAINGTTLSVRDRELLILRIAIELGAPAEVDAHLALYGADADLDRAAVGAPDPWPGLDPRERDLVALADAIARHAGEISDELWARLHHDLGATGLVEALFVATQYVKVGLLHRALRIPATSMSKETT